MPIYEYHCNQCGHELEVLQKISDSPLLRCPDCDTDSLKKKISAPRFRLSGSGWYETDFKSDGKKNLAQSDSAEKDSSGKSADGKTSDSKGEKTEKPSTKPGTSAGGGGTGKEAVA